VAHPARASFAGLTVQTVLYGDPPAAVMRTVEAAAAAVHQAFGVYEIDRWTLRIGDCSPRPVMSDDDIANVDKVVKAAGGDASVEWFDANLGSAGGHNRLMEQATTQLAIIMNPVIMAPDMVTRILSSMGPDVGIVEARQLPIEHPKDYDRQTGETSWSSGACSLVEVELFRQLGGYDSASFFLYCDDVDLSWRVRLAGKKVVHQPLARVFHDKRLEVNGQITPGEAELYYSAEAAMILAYKYSRPDLAESIAAALTAGTDDQRRAVKEFRRRQRAGELPKPIDPDHRVAQFVNGDYAVHRTGPNL
jgi:hypothetical protein